MAFTKQLGGWAIDRALETMKIGVDVKSPKPEEVIKMAEKYAKWVDETAKASDAYKDDMEKVISDRTEEGIREALMKAGMTQEATQ